MTVPEAVQVPLKGLHMNAAPSLHASPHASTSAKKLPPAPVSAIS